MKQALQFTVFALFAMTVIFRIQNVSVEIHIDSGEYSLGFSDSFENCEVRVYANGLDYQELVDVSIEAHFAYVPGIGPDLTYYAPPIEIHSTDSGTLFALFRFTLGFENHFADYTEHACPADMAVDITAVIDGNDVWNAVTVDNRDKF